MANFLQYHPRSFLQQFTYQIVFLELISPFPLIFVGLSRVLNPLVVGSVITLAVIPWVTRWFVLGRLSRPTFADGPLTLFVISAFIGTWAAYDPNLSWPMLLTLLGSVNLFFTIINAKVSLQRLSAGLVLIATLVAVYFISQFAHFHYPEEAGGLARLGLLTGSFLPNLVFFTPHPNAVANFLVGVLLLCLILTGQTQAGQRMAWSLAAGLIGYGLLISESRGAWFGLAVALSIWGLLGTTNRVLRLVLVGVGSIGALLSLWVVIHLSKPDHPVFILSSMLNTADSRFTLYRNSFNLWGDYLFTGIGLGNTFALIYSRYQLLINVPYLYYAHNLFLSVGLALGVGGLGALLWLMIGFYCFVARIEQRGLNTANLPFFRAAWLGVTAVFVHGLTDSPQFADPGWTMPMLFALFGLAVSVGQQAEKPFQPIFPPAFQSWKVWTAILIAALIIGILFQRPLLSAWYANLGAVYQTYADLSPDLDDKTQKAAINQAIIYFERSLNLNPTQPIANRRLGMIALSWDNFTKSNYFLEKAYKQEPNNQATLKALGLAYLWVGRLDEAEKLLRQVNDQNMLIEELGIWSNLRESQGQMDLAEYAYSLAERLSVKR